MGALVSIAPICRTREESVFLGTTLDIFCKSNREVKIPRSFSNQGPGGIKLNPPTFKWELKFLPTTPPVTNPPPKMVSPNFGKLNWFPPPKGSFAQRVVKNLTGKPFLVTCNPRKCFSSTYICFIF